MIPHNDMTDRIIAILILVMFAPFWVAMLVLAAIVFVLDTIIRKLGWHRRP